MNRGDPIDSKKLVLSLLILLVLLVLLVLLLLLLVHLLLPMVMSAHLTQLLLLKNDSIGRNFKQIEESNTIIEKS